MIVQMIKEEGVCVFIADGVNKGGHATVWPMGIAPPLKIASADTVIWVVAVL